VRLALIANPGSGGGLDAGALAELLLDAGARSVDAYHPRDLDSVRAAVPDRLVAAGGDGTIGRCAAMAGRVDVPLALIPAGTANDFARAQRLPTDPREAARLAVTGTHLRRLELGWLSGGTPFVNVASLGLASVAAQRAATLKTRLGPLAYGVGALRAAAEEHPITVAIVVDGAPAFHGDVWQVIVAAGGHFGAGSRVDVANPRDGELDVAVIPAGSRLGLAWRALGMRTGGLARQRGVTHVRGCEVELHLPPGTDLNVDGEVVRAAEPERITARAGAFALVAPDR